MNVNRAPGSRTQARSSAVAAAAVFAEAMSEVPSTFHAVGSAAFAVDPAFEALAYRFLRCALALGATHTSTSALARGQNTRFSMVKPFFSATR